MTAAHCHRLPWLQLRCRHAEEQSLAEQRQAQRLHCLIDCSAPRYYAGIAVKMVRQRHVVPTVGKDIVLACVKMKRASHSRPLTPYHMPVAVLHLIAVFNCYDRMLARLSCHRLCRPPLSVAGVHQNVLFFAAAVGAEIAQHHVHAFSPHRIILYCKPLLHLPLWFVFCK